MAKQKIIYAMTSWIIYIYAMASFSQANRDLIDEDHMIMYIRDFTIYVPENNTRESISMIKNRNEITTEILDINEMRSPSKSKKGKKRALKSEKYSTETESSASMDKMVNDTAYDIASSFSASKSSKTRKLEAKDLLFTRFLKEDEFSVTYSSSQSRKGKKRRMKSEKYSTETENLAPMMINDTVYDIVSSASARKKSKTRRLDSESEDTSLKMSMEDEFNVTDSSSQSRKGKKRRLKSEKQYFTESLDSEDTSFTMVPTELKVKKTKYLAENKEIGFENGDTLLRLWTNPPTSVPMENEYNTSSLPSILGITSWGSINKSHKGKKRRLSSSSEDDGFNITSLPSILGIDNFDSASRSRKGKRRNLGASSESQKEMMNDNNFNYTGTLSPTQAKSGKKRRLKSDKGYKKSSERLAPSEDYGVFVIGNETIAPGSRKTKKGQRRLPSSELYDFYYH